MAAIALFAWRDRRMVGNIAGRGENEKLK